MTTDLGRDAVVELDEQADKGWSVTVDGHETPLVTVDGFYAGARVPAGHHEVRFSYTPPRFRLGLVLAALGGLLLVAAALLTIRERRTDRSAGAAERRRVE